MFQNIISYLTSFFVIKKEKEKEKENNIFNIYDIIKKSNKLVYPNYDCLHIIINSDLEILKNIININEKQLIDFISTKKYYTIRLKLYIKSEKIIRKILQINEYNKIIEDCIIETSKYIAKKVNAKWIYTYGCEIVLIIKPIEIEKHTCIFSGKKDKIISILSSIASVHATKIFNNIKKIEYNIDFLFHCKIAEWNNEKDAFQIIIKCAYDCEKNGLINSIKESMCLRIKELNMTDKKILDNIDKLNITDKLKYLSNHKMLPISIYKVYGFLFSYKEQQHVNNEKIIKFKHVYECVNLKTNIFNTDNLDIKFILN